MRRFLFSALLLAAFTVPAFADEARWMRYPAVSPDGERIAFSYKGDLWVVPIAGGEARPVTSHVDHERSPVWSPDSKWIAFASDRHGNFDVFVVSAGGGPEQRLTHHSASDFPSAFTTDGSEVYFTSSRQDAPAALVGTPFLPELYAVPVNGGRPRQVLTTAAEAARPDAAGKRLVYQDRKGYENEWRKHHTSSVTRDVWTVDLESGEHTRVTPFVGEDRDPWFAPSGGIVYLTEEFGDCFNVAAIGEDGTPRQITNHTVHPVRFLSVASNGTMVYGWNGGLYVLAPEGAGEQPVQGTKLTVEVNVGARTNAARVETKNDGATGFAVSPDEDEVAFIVRGEVFVASVEHGTTRRVTSTPEQERSLSWAPDGRSLYYASEREGSWNLFKASLARESDQRFFDAAALREDAVLLNDDENFQPVVSPDGKSIAFLRDRDEIALLDLASGSVRTLVPADRNYSYADGDISYEWSPDGKWLAMSYLPRRRWLDDVGVVEVATGKMLNVSDSGYSQSRPHWSPDGRALMFSSDEYGRRNHGSWGSDGDVMAVHLTRAAFDRARLSVEELSLLEPDDKDEDKDDGKDEADRPKRGRRGKQKDQPPPDVVIEERGLERRRVRLTLHAEPIGEFAVSPDGETVVYFARVERKWDLWFTRKRHKESSRLTALGDDSAGQVRFSKDGKTLFVRRGNGKIGKIGVGGRFESKRRGRRGGENGGGGGGGGGGGNARFEPIPFRAEMEVNGQLERLYIFHHAWRQVREKFYHPDLHGVDWEGMLTNYGGLLPEISNNHDFAELLSEMLGELNASHTGGRYRPSRKGGDATADLGLLFDPAYTGAGLLVGEVLEDGPADRADSRIGRGVVVTHVDGTPLRTDNPYPLLNRKAGKRVLLGLSDPNTDQTWEETIKPIGSPRGLLYERMVRRRRSIVHVASGGRVGYVHVRGMNDGSFRRVFHDALGKEGDREALIVDTRFNGGGWLHDDLVKFLEGRVYAEFVPRGKERGALGTEPFQRWSRPVAVVQSEGNYSDAHIFPYAFQKLGLGKLVGAPVAGTGTAVWWERQIDPTLVFGIPQVGMMSPDGKYLENQELHPDVLVYNAPGEMAAGTDKQLLESVRVLLEELK